MTEVGTKREAEEVLGEEGEAKRQTTAPAAPAAEEVVQDGAPPSPEPEDEAALPPNWEAHTSKRTGKTFWFNTVTQERTWHNPATPKPPAPQVPASPASPDGEPEADGQDPLHMKPPNIQAPTLDEPGASGDSQQQDDSGQPQPKGDTGPGVIHPLTRMPMRPGSEKCKHWVNHGSCKYGEACRFDHPPSCATMELVQRHCIAPGTAVPDGYALCGGLPLRPGCEPCSFHMKTGMCKFGNNCKYHHPPEMQTKLPTIARMPQRGEGKVAPQHPTALMSAEQVAMLGRRQDEHHPPRGGGRGGGHHERGGGGGGGRGSQSSLSIPPHYSPALSHHHHHHPAPPPQTPTSMPYPWELHHTEEGRPYYFNLHSQVSQWHPPPELERGRGGGAAFGAYSGGPPPMSSPGGRGGVAMANAMDPASGQHKFPHRPGQSDLYLKNGNYSYGENCKFNHPPDGRPSSDQEMHLDLYPVREGVGDCLFYMKTGECKFGNTCKYNHPPKETLGLPVREGKDNCPFFMKTGVCSYGRQCKYNHPSELTATYSRANPIPAGLSAQGLPPAPTM